MDDVAHATGIGLNVLDHDEEGFLTLIGVTEGRPVEQRLLVVDVGGGSSEFVSIGPAEPPVAAGVRVGAVALTSRLVRHDPPTLSEIDALRAAAIEAVAAAPDAAPDEIVVVGGTASNLLKLVSPSAGRGERCLGRAELAQALATIARLPSDSLAAAHDMKPARALILGAGAALLEAILDRYGHEDLRVADGGIREGTILATLHAGRTWRDRLGGLACGWVR